MYDIIRECVICGNSEIDVKNNNAPYMRYEVVCPKCAKKLKRLVDSAEKLIDAVDADGCVGCKHIGKDENEVPCVMCKNRYTNMWGE